ncbi:hypothetical protein LPB140_07210 [Sphingorhabdus lutea]|uniref:Uncharacterized protein n=1 Tax=Sphingorhabdus lutea TaxID=1913578 RepID=A0A1L3JBT4_9SPHN|nr:hypothetical protein [Sphingorhabdus lutea]APG62607.1 hypothetical protein LPB140_07210 [Sphingorhabdus lutea]
MSILSAGPANNIFWDEVVQDLENAALWNMHIADYIFPPASPTFTEQDIANIRQMIQKLCHQAILLLAEQSNLQLSNQMIAHIGLNMIQLFDNIPKNLKNKLVHSAHRLSSYRQIEQNCTPLFDCSSLSKLLDHKDNIVQENAVNLMTAMSRIELNQSVLLSELPIEEAQAMLEISANAIMLQGEDFQKITDNDVRIILTKISKILPVEHCAELLFHQMEIYDEATEIKKICLPLYIVHLAKINQFSFIQNLQILVSSDPKLISLLLCSSNVDMGEAMRLLTHIFVHGEHDDFLYQLSDQYVSITAQQARKILLSYFENSAAYNFEQGA